MKVERAYPPNYEVIEKRFPFIKGRHIVFAYGDTLYSPHGTDIPDHLWAHEETHERQQAKMGVRVWWDKYLIDDEFRLSQEVEAYRNQYQFLKEHSNRKFRINILKQIVFDLSSGIYGNLVTSQEAEELITCSS